MSKDYTEIKKHGYNDYLDNIYPVDKIQNFIEVEMNSNKDIYTLSIENDIHYIITDSCNVFFILGPISTDINNLNIPYKPL